MTGRAAYPAGQAAVWLAIAAAGVLMLVAVFRSDGISVGGEACGGAGSSQACLHIDRELSITDLGWFSGATITGSVLTLLAGLAGSAVPRARRGLAAAVLALTLIGLAGSVST